MNVCGQPRCCTIPSFRSRCHQSVAVASAFNALAHAVEALYAADADAETLLWAELGARALVESLPALAGDIGEHGRSRARLLRKLPRRSLPRTCEHGTSPQALPRARRQLRLTPRGDSRGALASRGGFNLVEAPEARARLGRALSAADPADALFTLAEQLRVPVDLAKPRSAPRSARTCGGAHDGEPLRQPSDDLGGGAFRAARASASRPARDERDCCAKLTAHQRIQSSTRFRQHARIRGAAGRLATRTRIRRSTVRTGCTPSF